MTIYEALKSKLGRDPTYSEIREEVSRIVGEARFDRVERLTKRRKGNRARLDEMEPDPINPSLGGADDRRRS